MQLEPGQKAEFVVDFAAAANIDAAGEKDAWMTKQPQRWSARARREDDYRTRWYAAMMAALG